MYVIVQGINNLSESDKKLPIHDRIGIAMKHAGISITVTSVTDMAAFLIGSSSVSLLVLKKGPCWEGSTGKLQLSI